MRDLWGRILAGLVLGLASIPSGASADVVQTSEFGFVISSSGYTKASAEDVWQILIVPSDWWNPDHSWTGNADNFELEAADGGCFCEFFDDGGFAEHMRVIHVRPNALLRLSGALGPLQSEAVTGTLSITLTREEGATRIDWTYVVSGYGRMPLADIAPAVDNVMTEQLARLIAAVETESGSPEAA